MINFSALIVLFFTLGVLSFALVVLFSDLVVLFLPPVSHKEMLIQTFSWQVHQETVETQA